MASSAKNATSPLLMQIPFVSGSYTKIFSNLVMAQDRGNAEALERFPRGRDANHTITPEFRKGTFEQR